MNLRERLGKIPKPPPKGRGLTPEELREYLALIGAALLDEVVLTLRRFLVLPDERHYDLLALWAALTWIYEKFDTSPRLAFMSLGPGMGKTLAMRVLRRFCRGSVMAANATAPSIFLLHQHRDGKVTIFLDETDTYLGSDASRREMRGMLNAGMYSDGSVLRGKATSDGDPEMHVFCPVCFGGIGRLPTTLGDRSFIIQMAKPRVVPEKYRPRLHNAQLEELGSNLGLWAQAVGKAAADTFPEEIPGIELRDWEKCEPILALAIQAGATWEERARAACALVTGAGKQVELPPGLKALADVREVFAEYGMPRYIRTSVLAEEMMKLPAWSGEWSSVVMAQRDIAGLLGTYGVHAHVVRTGRNTTARAYTREDLRETWDLVLPQEEKPPPEAAAVVTEAAAPAAPQAA